MNLKILLTGKNGQVGSELLHLLPRVGEVVAFDRHQLDLAKPEEIRQVIREDSPQPDRQRSGLYRRRPS